MCEILQLLSAMSKKLDLDKQLEQDAMEGVDEDEWVSHKCMNPVAYAEKFHGRGFIQ